MQASLSNQPSHGHSSLLLAIGAWCRHQQLEPFRPSRFEGLINIFSLAWLEYQSSMCCLANADTDHKLKAALLAALSTGDLFVS
jgi:hypothetical protein